MYLKLHIWRKKHRKSQFGLKPQDCQETQFQLIEAIFICYLKLPPNCALEQSDFKMTILPLDMRIGWKTYFQLLEVIKSWNCNFEEKKTEKTNWTANLKIARKLHISAKTDVKWRFELHVLELAQKHSFSYLKLNVPKTAHLKEKTPKITIWAQTSRLPGNAVSANRSHKDSKVLISAKTDVNDDFHLLPEITPELRIRAKRL